MFLESAQTYFIFCDVKSHSTDIKLFSQDMMNSAQHTQFGTEECALDISQAWSLSNAALWDLHLTAAETQI